MKLRPVSSRIKAARDGGRHAPPPSPRRDVLNGNRGTVGELSLAERHLVGLTVHRIELHE
jgi:hypothetical protein